MQAIIVAKGGMKRCKGRQEKKEQRQARKDSLPDKKRPKGRQDKKSHKGRHLKSQRQATKGAKAGTKRRIARQKK